MMRISLAAYALSVVVAFLDTPMTLPILLIPIASNMVYSSKLLPGVPRLKDIPVMKNFFVALSLALVCTLMPAVHSFQGITAISLAMAFVFLLVKLFINTVLYDIRDVKGDRENGVRTLPVLLGSRATVGILLALNSALLLWLILAQDSLRFLAAALIAYGYVYILYFRERRDPMVMDIFVDGEWIIATALFTAVNFFIY